MPIETDPRLWADPLWSQLANARLALLDNPHILFQMKPEWAGGLNSEAINGSVLSTRTSTKCVFERVEEKNADVVLCRKLRVHHPGPPPCIEITVWHKYLPSVPPASVVERVVEYLQAWKDLRASMLTPAAPAAVPPVSTVPPARVTKAVVAKLTQTERKVILVLAQRKIDASSSLRPSQNDISKWVGRRYNSGLKNTLSAMVKATWIGNHRDRGERGGYYLAPRGTEAAKFIHQS